MKDLNKCKVKLNIKIKDMDLDRALISIRQAKGKNDHQVPLSKKGKIVDK